MSGTIERPAWILGGRRFLVKNVARISLENLRAHVEAPSPSVETRLMLSAHGLCFGEKRRSILKSSSSTSCGGFLNYRVNDLSLVHNVFQMTGMPTVLVCIIRLEDEGEYFYEVVAFRLTSHDDVTLFIRMYAMLTLSLNNQTPPQSSALKYTDNHSSGHPNIRQNGRHSTLETVNAMEKSFGDYPDQSKQAEMLWDPVNNKISTNITHQDELQVPVRKSRSVLFQSMDEDSLLKSDKRREQSRKTTRSPTLMYSKGVDNRLTSRSESAKKGNGLQKTAQISELRTRVQNTERLNSSNESENEILLRNVGTMTPLADRNRRFISDDQIQIRWERPSDYELYCHRTKVYMWNDVGMADVSCQVAINSAALDNLMTSQTNDIGIYASVNKRQKEGAKSNFSENDNLSRNRAENRTPANVLNDREDSSGESSLYKRTYLDNDKDYLDEVEGRIIDENEYRIETFVQPKTSNSTSANKEKHIFTEDDELDHGFPFETSKITYPYVHAIINPSDSDQTSVSDIVFNSLPRKFQRDDSGWDSNSFDTLIEDRSADNEIVDSLIKYTKKSSVRSVNAIRKKSVKIDPASLNPTKVRMRPSSMHLVSQDDNFKRIREKDKWHSDDDQTVKFRRNIYSSSSSGKESNSTSKLNNPLKYTSENRNESNVNRENRSGFRQDNQSVLSNGKSYNRRLDKLANDLEGNGRRTSSHVFKGQDSVSPLSNEEYYLQFSSAGGGRVQPRERSRKSYIFDNPIREKDYSKPNGSQLKTMTSLAERDQNDVSKSRRPTISSEIYNISDFYHAPSRRRSESLDHERSDRSIITYLPIQDMQIRDTGLIKKIEQGRRRLFPNAPDKVSLKGRIFDTTAYKQRTAKVADQLSRHTISQESGSQQDQQNSTLSRGQHSDHRISGGGPSEKNWPHSEKGYASSGDYTSSGGGSDLEASRRWPTRRTTSSVIGNEDPHIYHMGQRRIKSSKKGHDQASAGPRVYRGENERLKNKNNDVWNSEAPRSGRRSVLNERGTDGISRGGGSSGLRRSQSISRDERPISRHGARI